MAESEAGDTVGATTVDILPSLLMFYNLKEEDWHHRFLENDLEIFARCRCSDWKSLPDILGVDKRLADSPPPQPSRDDDSDYDFPTMRDRKQEFFTHWRRVKGRDATYKKLIDALIEIKSWHGTDRVCRLLRSSLSAKCIATDTIPPDPSVPRLASLHPDVHADLRQQLDHSLKELIYRYASYVKCILTSIEESGISHQRLRNYLLSIPAFKTHPGREDLMLFYGLRDEFEGADALSRIFITLSIEYASFLNPDVFQSMVDEFQLVGYEEKLDYMDHFWPYMHMHKLSEFMEVNPLSAVGTERAKKLVVKFDISLASTMGQLMELKEAFGNALGLRTMTVRLKLVEEGCVIVSFLIPTPVANFLFHKDTKFGPKKVAELRNLSVVLMKCNDFVFDFRVKQPGDDKTSSPEDTGPPSADDERLKRTKETQTDFS